ncbi:hypothetical protein GLOTRDRAFT_134536 [Gloeophyllum trabeum ATCC 11539]|uniref:Uncharacterized protein n=1 Tax=Gloeophyllum trabeum (strain ATCC 11539 / FP-39264 / Madison 617) TaxID=670483 RepID=S7PPQ0_GLOTA|nr:uncharacterized protein GLOTRDRAFT_134536 [Gloeophyllum trabeum ATCC 11539]EPQ49851.1 hypothetical protein GLOTRDRAFT_134536 [Gloeophyllum trabeum ATCC 11539]
MPPAPPPAVPRSNPPRGSRPKRSLNWNALERDNTAPAHSRVSPAAQTPPPPSPASSPDPLALGSPPAAPALDLEPAPVSDDDDELRLPGALGEDLDSAEAMSAAMEQVLTGQVIEYWSWEEAAEFAFASLAESAFKGAEHAGEPRTFHEAMLLRSDDLVTLC